MTEITRDKPTAVLGRRYVAHVIDLIVYAAALVVPFLLLGEEFDGPFVDNGRIADAFRLSPDYAIRLDDSVWLFTREDLIIMGAVAAGVGLLFAVLIQGLRGWTVGKALTGIRTVKGDGGRPGIIRAFFRTLLLPIDTIPGQFLPLIGGFFILVTDDNRRLGDLATGTYVVARDAMGADPRAEADVDTSGWTELGDEPLPVTTLDEGEPLRVGEAAPTDPDAEEPLSERAPATAEAGAASAGEKPSYQPQWDPARKAYLQWDPRKQVWLQFDDAAQEWRPVDQ